MPAKHISTKAGTFPIVDRLSGKTRPAQIFVAVMGASNFTYAEATWTQSLPNWIAAHTRAFAMIGGVPKFLVPDYVPGHIIWLMCLSPICGRKQQTCF
jgi:transposase